MTKLNSPEEALVKARGDVFSDKVSTKVCQEIPDPENPFVAQRVLWHGYDVLDLMERRSLVEVIFCLLKGELPSAGQASQLQQILILLANPGPRHAGTRAVMNASVSRADPLHLLPIGLALLGGEHLGAAQVRNAIKFLRKNIRKDPLVLAVELSQELQDKPRAEGEPICVAPGFGSCFAGVDTFADAAAVRLHQSFPDNEALAWGVAFVSGMRSSNLGWQMPGIAAAIFTELGFSPNVGAGLFQLASSPGLLAHGIEMSGKPITDMPFVSDSHYHYQWSGSDD
jgi:citrate synthase